MLCNAYDDMSNFSARSKHQRCDNIPLDLIIEAIRWGSLSLVDAFNIPLEGTYHETFMRGVMAPPTGVRARGQLWLLYEEIMERLYDVFNYPHELIIHGGWDHALRHKVANGVCGVGETEREHYRGAPGEVFRGERLSPGKLQHDVGE